MLPAYEYGRMASRAVLAAITPRKRSAMRPSASSQEMRAKRPSPLRPTRFIGCRMRSGLYTRSR